MKKVTDFQEYKDNLIRENIKSDFLDMLQRENAINLDYLLRERNKLDLAFYFYWTGYYEGVEALKKQAEKQYEKIMKETSAV